MSRSRWQLQDPINSLLKKVEDIGPQLDKSIDEILDSREFWTVVEVFDQGLPEHMLREQQKLNRHSLPSVEGMG
jgi:hypothetical protein